MYESLWYQKFYNQMKEIVGDDPCSCKEKYGRFDCSYHGTRPGVLDILLELERESEETCQRCAKHTRQIRTDWGWVEHWCWKCFLVMLCIRYKNKTRRYWNRFKKKCLSFTQKV